MSRERTGDLPLGLPPDETAGNHDADGLDAVAQDVQEGGLDVDVLLLGPVLAGGG